MQGKVVYVDKPKGITSRDVVNVICRNLKTKRVGHCGTLDPMATGVLIVCVENATKLVPFLTGDNKEYEVVMKLGESTTSGDVEGEVVNCSDLVVEDSSIKNVFDKFPRIYLQTVPKYSAVKVNGKKLYEYAREGLDVDLPARNVEIIELKLLNIWVEDERKYVKFSTKVSKGTYVRSLCEDIASKLNTYATMTSLVRTAQGNVALNMCDSLDEFKLHSIEDVDFSFECHELTEQEYDFVKHGRIIDNRFNVNGIVGLKFKGRLAAIYESVDDILKSKRGFVCNDKDD